MKKTIIGLFALLVLLSITGCIKEPTPYIPPAACVGADLENSMILNRTGGDPRTLVKMIKTGMWAGVIAEPEHITEVKLIISDAETMLDEGVSYFTFFMVLNQRFNTLDAKYMLPLMIWMPNFDPTNQEKLPINQCDIDLILKNLGEVSLLIDQL